MGLVDADDVLERLAAQGRLTRRQRPLPLVASTLLMCRIGFVETVRAVALAAGESASRVVRDEWGAFEVVDVDQRLVEDAATLAAAHDLRSLGALHLASAALLAREDLIVATWDRRLHAAATGVGLRVLPAAIE